VKTKKKKRNLYRTEGQRGQQISDPLPCSGEMLRVMSQKGKKIEIKSGIQKGKQAGGADKGKVKATWNLFTERSFKGNEKDSVEVQGVLLKKRRKCKGKRRRGGGDGIWRVKRTRTLVCLRTKLCHRLGEMAGLGKRQKEKVWERLQISRLDDGKSREQRMCARVQRRGDTR